MLIAVRGRVHPTVMNRMPRILTTLACVAGIILQAGAVEKIQIMGLFKDKAVVSVNGKQRVLKKGRPSPEGITLISADSKQAVLEIDGKQKSYTLGSHIGGSYAPPKDFPKVSIWPTSAGMYNVVGSINGYPVNFLVDTGATLIAMNKREAKRLGIDYLVVGEPGFSSTASGVVRTYYVLLDKVRVGDIELKNIRAGVIDADFPTEVLLGMSFLGRLDMQRQGRMLELRKKF